MLLKIYADRSESGAKEVIEGIIDYERTTTAP